ncbi:hypothetical protein N8599_01290, partial [Verrucomicrobiales bacterium]|nr:hypothetical protein [Verrucomicrobiales bacterium]
WKLIMEGRKPRGKRELYNLKDDPGEKKNLIKSYPKIESELTKKITHIIVNGRSSPGKSMKNDTPPWPDLVWMKK